MRNLFINSLQKLTILMLSFSVFFGCNNDPKKAIEPKQKCTENSSKTASFHNDIQPILAKNCAQANCHQGVKAAGSLNLEAGNAYAELTNSRSGYLDTINPRKSLLYNSITSTTNPMPPNGRLDDCSIEMIEKWIEQNAQNN